MANTFFKIENTHRWVGLQSDLGKFIAYDYDEFYAKDVGEYYIYSNKQWNKISFDINNVELCLDGGNASTIKNC